MKPRILIMSGYGINCERESAHAFELAGAKTDIVHINDITAKRKQMSEYDVMMFPGGFSYGDDTGSGNAYANKIKNHLWNDLIQFIEAGKLILGICNGFQIMSHLGLFATETKNYGERTNALEANDSNRYECLWVDTKHQDSISVFTKGVDKSHIPIAHGEGKFYCAGETLAQFKKSKQIVFTYDNFNPNGSLADIAAICDKTGRIMGMMPHPERALYSILEPEYPLKKELSKRNGIKLPELIESNLLIFKNAVMYVK